MCPVENFVHSCITIEVQVHMIAVQVVRSFREKNEFVISHSIA